MFSNLNPDLPLRKLKENVLEYEQEGESRVKHI